MLAVKFNSLMLFLIAIANVIIVMSIRQQAQYDFTLAETLKDNEFIIASDMLKENNCINAIKASDGISTYFYYSMPRLIRGDVPTHTTSLCANIIANYPVQTVKWLHNLNKQKITWKEK
jgi:hypothetical protein